MKRYEGDLSDAGPDASTTRVCVVSSGTRSCISTMNMTYVGDMVSRTSVARKEFKDLWLDVCVEVSALDSGDPGVPLTSLDALFGK